LASVDLREETTPLLQLLLDDRGMLWTQPFAHGLETFFAASLRRH